MLEQDDTEESELHAAASGPDGSVVLAGETRGDWDGINKGSNDFAAVKLNSSDGKVIWSWQVRIVCAMLLCPAGFDRGGCGVSWTVG